MSTRAPGPRSSDLARRVMHRREELGLSHEEVAQRTGMDAGYLEYVEQNPGAALSNGSLLRLARALDTTPASLAGGDIERPPGAGRAGPRAVLDDLTPEQCEARLSAGGVGRVVFVAGSDPVALPVNFALVDGVVAFCTGARQAALLATAATVGFEADRIDEAMSEGWSVLVNGAAHVVDDAVLGKRLRALGVEPWAGGDRSTFVLVEPRHISGRSIRQQPTRKPPR